ncbi:MAG TPA: reverse transcriptase-like protein [Solirubrobacterales bacterium]|nr:reverse transcriptase-like protein [Solirubrobacterales bacterium]
MSRLVVNVDGGARGNPGPAAIAAIVRDSEGKVLERRGEQIGRATSNVAEYRALLLGIELAASLGASELELIGDSQLIVRQVSGEYKVKDATLKKLNAEVKGALAKLEKWSIRHVPREQNAAADKLVNMALDGELDGGPVPAPQAGVDASPAAGPLQPELPACTGAIDPGVDIGHVHLKVADLDRALEFYCGVLGFELQQRFGDEAAFVAAGGYHHHIGLNTWASKGGSPPPPQSTGLYHVAIRYPTRRALSDALRRLTAAAVRLEGASDHGVSEALYLSDPDGNGIELYWDRPREQWPRPASGDGVAMVTMPLDLPGLLAELDRS